MRDNQNGLGIKVHVVDYGRKHLVMRYVCPQTGKQVAKSTGVPKTRRREAERDSVLAVDFARSRSVVTIRIRETE